MANYPRDDIKWASIQPDAEYYSAMIAQLGITGIGVQQLNNLNSLTETLQPGTTFGIIIRYNNSENGFYQRTNDPRSSNIFFAKQPPDYASPIMALINILCNLNIDKGEVLQGILNKYFGPSFPLGSCPAHTSEEIKRMHNAYCWARQHASTFQIEPEIHNVVSYICKGADIWKFDSQRDCAFKLRAYGNWLYMLQDILKEKGEGIADIIALVREPLAEQEEAPQLVMETPNEEDEMMPDIKLEELIEHVDDQGSTESSPTSEELNPINDPNRREKTSWNLRGKQIKSAECRVEEINRRTRTSITKVQATNVNGKGKVTKRKSVPKTTNNSSKKGVAPRKNGKDSGKKDTASSKKGTASSKKGAASGKKDTTSNKKGAASGKKDTTSIKNGTTSGKKDTASGKSSTTSTKKTTASNKNGKTGGATSCSKKKGQKRSREDENDEGDEAERKRYCNARNSYNLRSR